MRGADRNLVTGQMEPGSNSARAFSPLLVLLLSECLGSPAAEQMSCFHTGEDQLPVAPKPRVSTFYREG